MTLPRTPCFYTTILSNALACVGFQAVHVPYADLEEYIDGVPSSYFADGVYDSVIADLALNSSRLHYTMSLILMDQAIESVVKELDAQQQLDNSYVIFVSDNGGCTLAGARNGDLRGAKGTLFEGTIPSLLFSFYYNINNNILFCDRWVESRWIYVQSVIITRVIAGDKLHQLNAR